MAAVITVMNMKGGVGKTTVAMHFGGMICWYKKICGAIRKVLLIDYDPQFNLSQAFIPPKTYFNLEKHKKTTFAILQDEENKLDPFRLQVPGNEEPPKLKDITHNLNSFGDGRRLDIISSTLDLMYVALGHTEKRIAPIEERFNKFIAECRDTYDVIIIDCHPAGSILTKTALRNSDHVIIPVAPDRYAVRGVGLMMKFIRAKQLGSLGPEPHILFNAMKRTGISPEESKIRSDPRFRDKCMGKTMKFYKAFSDPMEGRGFVWLSKKPYSTQAFINLYSVVEEFHDRTGI